MSLAEQAGLGVTLPSMELLWLIPAKAVDPTVYGLDVTENG